MMENKRLKEHDYKRILAYNFSYKLGANLKFSYTH